MASSETVKALINQSYKQNRHEEDLNQPRAVKPWGSDGDKRRYFLVEGQEDTNFRVYRESNPAGATRTWWSVAGTIEELKALAEKLETKDGGPKAKALSHKILMAVPRFEAGEEVSTTTQPSTPVRRSADRAAETQTQGIPSGTQGAVQATRTWLLFVRGPHSRKAYEIHLFRRRGKLLVRLDGKQTLHSKYGGKHTSRNRSGNHVKRTTGQSSSATQYDGRRKCARERAGK